MPGKITITRERAAQYIKTAFAALQENDDSMSRSDLLEKVGARIELTDYELERHEKTGYVRWESVLSFYSIAPVKAGWLIKRKGVWHLTPEGKDVSRLSDAEFANLSSQKYREWKKQKDLNDSSDVSEDEKNDEVIETSSITFERAASDAYEEIEKYVTELGPYEFQDLVAALLRGMGYFTPFIAPKGPDGGIDLKAYKDPLGTSDPRIIVQVKQKPGTRCSVTEIRELGGLLRRDGDVGLFVATGGFTKDARSESNNSIRHIELIDLRRFVELWQEHYDAMSEEDKSLMPLREILFLSPER